MLFAHGCASLLTWLLIVFGVDLRILLQREAQNGIIQPGAVPFFLTQCLTEIELRGLTEVGICKSCAVFFCENER